MIHSSRAHARAAGALYLITHVSSVAAVVAYDGDRWRAGVTLELVLAFACVGTGVLVWTLLAASGPARAATFALLRTVEGAVIVAGTLPMAASGMANSPTAPAADALASVHDAAFLIGQGLVISVNTIVLGWLLLASRRVPRTLAWLGMAGGATVLASNLAQLWGAIPLNGTVAGIAAAPIFAFEIWFALLLLTRGLRPRDAAQHSTPVPPATVAATARPAS